MVLKYGIQIPNIKKLSINVTKNIKIDVKLLIFQSMKSNSSSVQVVNQLISEKEEIIKNTEEMKKTICDMNSLTME